MRQITGLLDAPARSAVWLATRPPTHTLLVGIGGLGAIALATVTGQGLVHGFGHILSAPMWSIRGVVLAFAIVSPAALAAAVQLRTNATPRILIGGFCTGLFTGGLVVVSLIPMMLFLSLITDQSLPVWLTPVVVFPFVALLSSGMVVLRVVKTFSSGADVLFGYAFFLALPAVFAVSAWSGL